MSSNYLVNLPLAKKKSSSGTASFASAAENALPRKAVTVSHLSRTPIRQPKVVVGPGELADLEDWRIINAMQIEELQRQRRWQGAWEESPGIMDAETMRRGKEVLQGIVESVPEEGFQHFPKSIQIHSHGSDSSFTSLKNKTQSITNGILRSRSAKESDCTSDETIRVKASTLTARGLKGRYATLKDGEVVSFVPRRRE